MQFQHVSFQLFSISIAFSSLFSPLSRYATCSLNLSWRVQALTRRGQIRSRGRCLKADGFRQRVFGMSAFWHIYRRHQIKPELRGHLIYLLEVAKRPGLPVLRHVFDPTGRDFPIGRRQAATLLRRLPHGIVYRGINKEAVYEVLLRDPPITLEDPQFIEYNRGIISNSREFFLIEPWFNRQGVAVETERLLCGDLVMAEEQKLGV